MSNLQYSSIGSGNDLAPNRRQAIIWFNADPILWRIYAAQGGDGRKIVDPPSFKMNTYSFSSHGFFFIKLRDNNARVLEISLYNNFQGNSIIYFESNCLWSRKLLGRASSFSYSMAMMNVKQWPDWIEKYTPHKSPSLFCSGNVSW